MQIPSGKHYQENNTLNSDELGRLVLSSHKHSFLLITFYCMNLGMHQL